MLKTEHRKESAGRRDWSSRDGIPWVSACWRLSLSRSHGAELAIRRKEALGHARQPDLQPTDRERDMSKPEPQGARAQRLARAAAQGHSCRQRLGSPTPPLRMAGSRASLSVGVGTREGF